jgi:AcrR family transcriptional regulator
MSPRPYRSRARAAATAENRERILEAARSLLTSDDPSAFTVDAVAERADVARMTVYNQFGSKRGLVEALSDHLAGRGGLNRLPEAFQANSAAAGLELLIKLFVGFWDSERPALRRLRALIELDPELRDSGRDARRRQAIGVLVERLAAEDGRPSAPELDSTIDLLWALTGFEAYEHLAAGGRTAADVTSLVIAAARRLLDAPGRRMWSAKP